jgi:DNA-binding CsgD family transcriptional regulator
VKQLHKNISIVLFTNNIIKSLGIKTMLSVIGFKYEIFDIDNYIELKDLLLEHAEKLHLIVSDELCNEDDLTEIQKIVLNSPILVFSDSQSGWVNGIFYVSLKNSQREILSKIDYFFQKDSTKKQENSIISEREKDILTQVALGLSNKEIAEKLFISINTVITHRKNITEKLGIKTIAGLTIYAILNNYINPENGNL